MTLSPCLCRPSSLLCLPLCVRCMEEQIVRRERSTAHIYSIDGPPALLLAIDLEGCGAPGQQQEQQLALPNHPGDTREAGAEGREQGRGGHTLQVCIQKNVSAIHQLHPAAGRQARMRRRRRRLTRVEKICVGSAQATFASSRPPIAGNIGRGPWARTEEAIG